jgi:hypothetical protein
MPRSILVACLLACATRPAPVPAASGEPPPACALACPPGFSLDGARCFCEPGAPPASARACLVPAEADREARRLEKLNAETLDAAIARLGLERVELQALHPEIVEGMHPHFGLERLRPEWSTEPDASGRTVLSGPQSRLHCPADPRFSQAAFVRRADGTILLLEAVEEPGATVEVLGCGCGPHAFPGCGAFMPHVLQQRWLLPAGSRFGGRQRVTWPSLAIERRWTQVEGCPPPVFPPSSAPGKPRPPSPLGPPPTVH